MPNMRETAKAFGLELSWLGFFFHKIRAKKKHGKKLPMFQTNLKTTL